MAKTKKENALTPDFKLIHQKLDAVLAVLLRQINDEVVGITYGSVANIRSKTKKGRK